MTNPFMMPPTGFGPGSQTQGEEETLDYMSLPQDMRTYAPSIPEIDALPGGDLTPALALLAKVSGAAAQVATTGVAQRFDLGALDSANRGLIAETLGSGEVAAKVRQVPALAVQESVFAGIWTLQSATSDWIEVAEIPDCIRTPGDRTTRPGLGRAALDRPGVANAPSILVELMDKSAGFDPDAPIHVVNLTLLPHSEEDLIALDAALGEGAVTILSRGYGNCRITQTALAHVWRVQFFNSQDVLILDTFEVTDVPEVACAAPEDLTDSAQRLARVLEAIA